jgi:hypothetical protein
VRAYVHRNEFSYVYEYLRLYYVSSKIETPRARKRTELEAARSVQHALA